MISPKLKELEQLIREKHPRLIPNLIESDLTEQYIREQILDGLKNCEVPEELIELYMWKNGTKVVLKEREFYTDIDCESFFIPAWYFMSFSEALQNFREKRNFFKYKNQYYFPFLYTGFDHFLCVKISSPLNEADRAVFLSTVPRSKVYGNYMYYESFQKFIETISECYRQGVYYENINNLFCCDSVNEGRISYNLNPGSTHWQAFEGL
jgi:hypothetical protein